MIKSIFGLILLITTLSATTEAILKLDTKGHTGSISDIIVTKDGDVISASTDKTIRIWDNRTGLEKRKILGQIGTSTEGSIYAIALSKNEKYLAVGGSFSYYQNKNRVAGIRIYNYQTGELLHILKSHTDVVYDLAFSDDGDTSEFLISCSSDKTAKIWDVRDNFRLKDTIRFHTDTISEVKIIKKRDSYFIITVGLDNQIALYDMEKRRVIKSDKLNHKLLYLATNKQIKHIAVCGSGKEITIYDFNLQKVRTIKTKTKPAGLAYDKKGDFLLVGTGSKPRNVNLYNIKNNYFLYKSFEKHTNVADAVAFLRANNKLYAVSGGGNNSEIYIWDTINIKVRTKIEGFGSRVFSIGIKDDELAWGNVWTKKNGQSKFQKSISLKTFKISDKIADFQRISTINGLYTLSPSKGGNYGYIDGILNIKKDGVIKVEIVKDSTNGSRHKCYGWYKNFIVSGGGGGFIKIYNIQGQEVASLEGHIGTVWSIALAGDRLVSGSSDQTIKVWDLSFLDNLTLPPPELDEELINSYMKKYDWSRSQVIQAGKEQGISLYKESSSKVIHPMLNIFVSKDDEWVVWSNSGYFNASVEGDKYVGYHLNKGSNKEARYVGGDKFFDTLYRPDIIGYIWQTGSEKKAIAYASRTRKVKTVNIASALPPVVSLLSKSNIKTNKKSITIEFSVESEEDIKEVIVLHNGERLNTRGLQKKKNNNSKYVTVELDGGENIISIKVRNKFAMSDEVLVYATKTIKTKNIYKPTLYMLSIGVSKYENHEYNLGVADKDALSMAKMFKSQKGKIYKDVVVKTLTNKSAHSDNILDGLDWIDKEATSKDVVIIFIAGHGVNDDKGTYYFLSHDANLERLRRTAVKWTEIQDTISNLPSKVILLADTCHSGNITGTRRDITSAVKSIINSGSGSIIMTATTGSGYSYEQSDWGHGAFTKAILEGIGSTKADYDSDGTVTIKEIDLYVTNRVKKLTKGKQKPTTIIPNSVPDFAIGVK